MARSRVLYSGVIAVLALAVSISISMVTPSFALSVHPSTNQRQRSWRRQYTPSATLPSLSTQRSRFDITNLKATAASPETTHETEAEVQKKHKHTLAILTMPHSASARIANEAILETAISITTDKLSVVLRTNTGGLSNSQTGEEHTPSVSLTQLRRYAGEIYSMAWDAALGLDEREENNNNNNSDTKNKSSSSSGETTISAGPITSGGKLLDLIVYPQNMPNTPPEGWIDLRPDLSCICSHDSITGWVTSDLYAGGSGRQYADKSGQGSGGLVEHVNAVNAERSLKGLEACVALHVDDWPDGAEVTGDPNVVFLEDEDAYEKLQMRGGGNANNGENKEGSNNNNNNGDGMLLGSTAIPPSSLYSSVCVGGTFDGMHYGHRKLLTLAISSVQPINGRLLIGITRDEMLTHKSFAERIPPLKARMDGVLDFIGNLAPGMKNRIRCVAIADEYGPPGQPGDSEVYPGLVNDFDALVLSHETLPTGRKLNNYREKELGLGPLKLLCTQRTEPHGMSSTALRRMRQ